MNYEHASGDSGGPTSSSATPASSGSQDLHRELRGMSYGAGAARLSPTSSGGTTYVVKRGDTLGKIARRFYGEWSRWRRIAAANGIADPRRLRVGQRLVIPGTTSPSGGGGGGAWSSPSPTDSGTTYVVKRGDTLGEIARRFYGDGRRWQEIARANDIRDPRRLQIGQRLTIPGRNGSGGGGGGGARPAPPSSSGGTTYVVKRGDTLGKIAQRYYGDWNRWREIAAANDISDPRRLRVGQRLTVPGANAPAPTPTPTPTPTPSPAPTPAPDGDDHRMQIPIGDADPTGQLGGVHPELQARVRVLIRNAREAGLDIRLQEGMRSFARQDRLYAQGRTRPGSIVTYARGGESRHNYGIAMDVVFRNERDEPSWDNGHPWSTLGDCGRRAGLEWGGDWTRFVDRPHFQLPNLRLADLQRWYAEGGLTRVWQNIGGSPVDSTPDGGGGGGGGTTYVVRRGDTLSAIARQFYGDASRWPEIARANGITDPRSLRIGQTLVIPGAATTPTPPTQPPPTSPAPVNEPGTFTVTDPLALIRTPPPALASTGEAIPAGTRIRIVESFQKDGADYVRVVEVGPEDGGPARQFGWTKKSNLAGFELGYSAPNYDPTMAPDDPILLTGLSGHTRTLAKLYNARARYLKAKATELGIDVAVAAAVLQEESSGLGFGRDGRMIVRFENHVFWDQWGKNNPGAFERHLQFNRDGQRWTGHKYRTDPNGAWQSFHGTQSREWEVLGLARGFADEPALRSISMGIAQVMGFNHRTLGYASAREMFDTLSGAIRPQVDGMFDFIRNKTICMQGLREGDYVKFATGYNGSGKAHQYAGRIRNSVDAWRRATHGCNFA